MATQKRGEIYRCPICGNVVEVIFVGGGTLVCCGKPMILQKANSDDSASKEKHVPIIEGKKVKVGAIAHPMEPKHHIMWIEADSEDGEVERIFLEPSDKPEAEFDFKVKSAKAYCNLHGLWKSK
ncbi:MAG: desulfoferrodoxin family protein [archaeon]|nr:desulfoferrodoxin family protein [archaeon]